tara:strand:+ start:3562 stop:4224 length:663 start_codon:yes stop_codon:yes gene_type:complete
MAHLEKKIKLLATKLSSLQVELKVSREIMIQASQEVNEMFNKKYFPEIPVEPEKQSEETDLDDFSEEPDAPGTKDETPRDDPLEDEKEAKINRSAEKAVDPEVKKLFKKIAFLTHPDKLSKLSEYERKRKEELFRKAMLALENNDLVSLADIAMDLEIEAPDLTKEKLKEAEKKIIAIKKELFHIESTYVWKWFFCEDEEEKQKILTDLFGLMYANSTRA